MNLRRILIRILTPIVWRVSKARKLDALQDFSDTELDSGWQCLLAMEAIQDPKVKAKLFQHSLEEFFHAEMFASLLASLSSAPRKRHAFAREMLLRGRDPDAFLAFLVQVYVGETEINRDFLTYAKAHIDAPIRSLFLRIQDDEEAHEEDSWNLLVRFAEGKLWKLRWYLLRAHVIRAWRRYKSVMQSFGNMMLWLNLSTIYFVFGSLFFLPLRRRLYLEDDEQLEILRMQLGYAEAKAKR
jgi:hypothetical protein